MLKNINNFIANEIDIMAVDELVKCGIQKDQAVKLVTEFEFDPIQYFNENPLDDVEMELDF